MPVGVNSYETHSYELTLVFYDLITRTRAFVSSLSRFVKTCPRPRWKNPQNQQDSGEDETLEEDIPLVIDQRAI